MEDLIYWLIQESANKRDIIGASETDTISPHHSINNKIRTDLL